MRDLVITDDIICKTCSSPIDEEIMRRHKYKDVYEIWFNYDIVIGKKKGNSGKNNWDLNNFIQLQFIETRFSEIRI